MSSDPANDIYANHSTVEIDGYIRGSGMEVSRFELKQGLLRLHGEREIDPGILAKLVETACGISNNGPDRGGQIIVGVADKEPDAQRISRLDRVTPRTLGTWHVVGIDREAKLLGITLEQYHSLILQAFSNSELSEPTKSTILSSIDYNSYYGLGVVVISIPPQKEPTYLGDEMYWRDGDKTRKAKGAKQISNISRRF